MSVNVLAKCGAAGVMLLLAAAAGWFAGAAHADAQQHEALAGAQVSAALWQSTVTSQQGAIDYFKRHTQQQAADLRTVGFIADAAIAERATLQRHYDTLRRQRQQATTQAAHAHPDCANLARPLCPAVAERLFHPRPDDAADDH